MDAQGLTTVTRLCYALAGAAALACTAATSLLIATLPSLHGAASGAAARGQVFALLAPVLAAAACAAALVVGATRLLAFREERFISGMASWRRKGGLSLVPRQ